MTGAVGAVRPLPERPFGIQVEWLWDGPMTAALVSEQLEAFAGAGLHHVVVEPWDGLVAGTEPGFSSGVEYLSDAFFDLLAFAVDEARRLGLAVWLYDGNAAGHDTGAVAAVLADRPELAARQLVEVERGVRYEVRADDGPGRPRLDRLNPLATEALLDVLHRRVVERCGPIAGFWTDEPRLWGDVPWADGLVGEWSPAELSSLFGGGSSGEDRERRIAYWSAVTERYGSAFLAPIQRFHHQHGMTSLVQPLPDGAELADQMRSTGSLLQTQSRWVDLPGCDLWPGTSHDDVLRGDANGGMVHAQARSAAHLAGHAWVQAEPYGLQGWGVTLAHQKAVADRLLARGVNLIAPAVTHAHFGASQATFCGDFGPSNGPLWRYYDLLHRHIADVATVLASARHVAPVALLHPETSVWADGSDAAVRHVYTLVGGVLTATWRGFDVVPEPLLERALAEHGFSVVVLPGVTALLPGTVEVLERFAAGGGRVVTVEADADFAAVVAALDEVVAPSIRVETPVMDGPVPSTECYHGRTDEGDVFFLTNWPVDGQWLRSRVWLADGPEPVDVELPPGGSTLLRLSTGNPPRPLLWIPERGPGSGPVAVSYEAVALPVPCAPPPADERAPLGDVAARHPGFVGVASYRFPVEVDDGGDYRLDLGDVRHAATVRIDGAEAARLPWPPYWVDTALSAGEHEVTVEVVGTAANAVPGPDYDPRAPWGLFGPVTLRRML